MGLGVRLSPWSLQIAGAVGAQLAFIRPVCPVRYRGLQLAGGPVLTGPHKPGLPGATPGPATLTRTGYANWQSGEVESLVPVGSTPTSVTYDDPVVQRRRRLGDSQENDGSSPSGITCKIRSVGVLAAHLLGKEEDRVQFPDGPLEQKSWAGMYRGATDPCKIGVVGSTPIRSTGRQRAHGPTGRHQNGILEIRVQLPVGPLRLWKVVGYGWPSRFAKPCPLTGMWVQIPCLPLVRCPDGETDIMPRF